MNAARSSIAFGLGCARADRAKLLDSPPFVHRLSAAHVNLTILATNERRVVETLDVRGLGVDLVTKPDVGVWRLHATIGATDAPLSLDVVRERDGAPPMTARAKLSLTADLSTSTLTVASHANVLAQSFAPSMENGEWHTHATAHFEPSARRTIVVFDHVRAAAGAASAEATLELPDEADPILRHATGDIDGARLLAWLPAGARTRMRGGASEAALPHRLRHPCSLSSPRRGRRA